MNRFRTRRVHRWCGALAAAAFCLRALIPTGYMLAAVDGQVSFVVCPAGMLQMHHGGHAAFEAGHCPYASSGGAGPLAVAATPQLPYFAVLKQVVVPVVETIPVAPPPRFHAPRGPPSLA